MEASIEKLEQQIYMQEEDKRIRALFTQKQSIRSNLELVSRRNQHGSRDGQRMSQENHRPRNHNRPDNQQSRQNRQSLDLQIPVPPPGQQLPRNAMSPPNDEYLETRRDQPNERDNLSRNHAERSHRERPDHSPLLSRDDGARESIRLQQQLINESNSRMTGSETSRGTSPPSPTYTPPKGIPTSNQPNRITRKKFSQISYF